jgi:hypothetical protein
MQRYIPTNVQQSDSNNSKNWSMFDNTKVEFFSWSSSKLLLEVVDEDGGIACSTRSEADNRDGLVAVWPKTSRRENKEQWWCRARKEARLGNENTVGGLSFFSSTQPQQSSRTIWGRGWRSDAVVATRGSIMVGPWGLGDAIVAARKRWQSDATVSYSRGTEKDGVQRPDKLTVMVRSWQGEFSKIFHWSLVHLFHDS